MSPFNAFSLKNLVITANFDPCNPVNNFPNLLGNWFSTTNNTLNFVGGGNWGPICNNGTPSVSPFNNSSSGAFTTSVINGIPVIGNTQKKELDFSPPNHAAPIAPVTFFGGSVLTVYIVMNMTDMATFGEPGNGVFQVGYHDTTFGTNKEVEFQVKFLNSPSQIRLRDSTGIATPLQTAVYLDDYDMPSSMISEAPGILVVQTQRNSGHRVRWEGVDLVSVNNTAVPTVADFSATNSLIVASLFATDNSITYFSSMGNCFVGQLLVYQDYHTTTQIQQVESFLSGIWGV